MERAAPLATFATELRRCRLAAGLTQEELAERAHLSVRGIADLERGARRAPRKETVQLLAEALALEAPTRAAFEAAARRQVETDRDPLRAADGPAHARAIDPARSNLPLLRTSFVGRAREQAIVEQLLATTGLVTLTGAGGCGKTRLALQVAAALQPSYPDGVWLVELAALGDATLVPQAVASVLRVREKPGQPLLAGLTGFLQPKHLLLVMDNCEHLVAACAGLVDALLRVCPRLTILATSREAVDVAGERLWKVPSLALPMPHAAPGVVEAGEAVQLFVQRARAAREGFALTERNADVVAQICRRVDGIPLAIELAAARLATISVEQLADRLDDRFRLLTGGNRSALPRQQTLRATLDWSYDLLGEAERILLRRLCVFAGTWTLEAAESICAVDIGAEAVLNLLAALVNKSLVALDEGGVDTRYRLLETVRQYGHEKLVAAGEAAQLRDRHLDWYLALAVQAASAQASHEQAAWLERLELDLENLRASLTWATAEVARQEKGVQLAESAWIWWYTRGHVSEGRRRLEDLLAHGDRVATVVRARALVILGALTWSQGDYHEAMQLLETAHVLFIEEGDWERAAFALFGQGQQALYLGDLPHASRLLGEVLRMYRELDNRGGEGWTLCHLGIIPHLAGDYAAAEALYEESLRLLQDVGDAWGVGNQLANLANVARDLGDHARATSLHRESLAIRRTLKDQPGFAECFEGLAVAAAGLGQPERAARLLGAAEQLREAIGRPLDLLDRAAHERTVGSTRAALGHDLFTSTWTDGRALPLEEVIELALQDGERG